MNTLHRSLLLLYAIGLGVCLLIVMPRSAHAQDQTAAAAEALFRSAQEAGKAGDWETACRRFAESNRLDPAPGTVLNLARCHEELGHQASAWKFYQEAAEKLPAGDRRAEYAERKAAELEGLVPTVLFDPPPDLSAEDFKLTVNGTIYSAAMLNVAIPFDAGQVQVVVEAKGRESVTTTLDLSEGQELTYPIRLGELVTAAPKQRPPSHAAKQRKMWAIASLTVGGLGAATAIFGATWAAMELRTATDPDHCSDGFCDQQGASASKRGRTAVVLLGTGAAVAAVGLSVGTVLLLKKDESTLALRPLPGGGMLTLTTHGLPLLGGL